MNTIFVKNCISDRRFVGGMNYLKNGLKHSFQLSILFFGLLLTTTSAFCTELVRVKSFVKEGEPFFLVSLLTDVESSESKKLQYKKEGATIWSNQSILSSNIHIGPCQAGANYTFKIEGASKSISMLAIQILSPIEDKEVITNNYYHCLGQENIVRVDQDELLISHKELNRYGYTYFELEDRHGLVVESYALENKGKEQYFKLPIAELLLRTDELYTFKKRSSNNENDKLRLIRVPNNATDQVLSAGIQPLPVSADCMEGMNNQIDFFADIEEGVAPYEIRWTVFEGRSEYAYLHNPVEQVVSMPSEISKLTVTDPIGYGVYFSVKDACDNVGEAYLYIGCKEDNHANDVIFFELSDGTEINSGTSSAQGR